jgi:hypothetical protein
MITILILLVVIALTIAVFPGVRRAQSGEASWIDAALKAVVVFLSVAVLTVFIPSWVMRQQKVAEFDRTAQDLIGATVWTVALIVVLWLLRTAQRQGRI